MIAPAVIITVLFAGQASADPNKHYLPKDPLAGGELFSRLGCEDCHAIEGQGGRFGPDLARTGQGRSLLDIFGLMWSHSPQMSRVMEDLRLERATFKGDELAELAAYVYVTAYFDPPGDRKAGKRVFTEKSCVRCHEVDRKGNDIGPNLTDMDWYVSPIFLVQIMWNHGPGIKSSMAENEISWPELGGSEVVDLMAYLRDESSNKDAAVGNTGAGSPRKGWKLFKKKKCISCHSVFDVGTAIGPDLSRSDFHRSPTSMAAAMWNHGPAIWQKMEELGVSRAVFKDEELIDLTAFLYFMGFSEDPADPVEGAALFERKGCLNCHHFDGDGPEDSYSLILDRKGLTDLEVAARMWNGAEVMSQAAIRKRVPWPYFDPGEMSDLISYILSRNTE